MRSCEFLRKAYGWLATARPRCGLNPLAEGSTTVLKPDRYHAMLLQTRQPLTAGGRFTCSIAFQEAAAIETEAKLRKRS